MRRRLWDACAPQNAYVCAWFRLRLITAQRGGELLQMRWRDIDPKSHFWTIPAEFVKNAHGHRVYLSARARALLNSVPRPEDAIWVFPKTQMGDYKHVGRRLAQSTRANIVAAPKLAGTARADIRGHAHTAETERRHVQSVSAQTTFLQPFSLAAVFMYGGRG